ncbi:MAG: hypothetical protein ACYC7A_21770 [Thermoanaerobaculia bacterium]
MLKAIESRLPVAEKQAEIIVKMLDSDEHRGKIEDDLKALIDDPSGMPLRETYLARVLAKLDAPIEKSYVPGALLFHGGVDSDGWSILAPNFLVSLSSGHWNQGYAVPMYDKEKILSDKMKSERLAAVCTRIMALQRPIQLAARSKFDVVSNRFGGGGRDGIKQGSSIYSIFLPDKGVGPEYAFFDMIEYRKADFEEIHPGYLGFVKAAALYLDEIGFSTGIPNWQFDRVAKAVDKQLVRLAETSDLSDLVAPSKTDAKKDIKLDDLILPK